MQRILGGSENVMFVAADYSASSSRCARCTTPGGLAASGCEGLGLGGLRRRPGIQLQSCGALAAGLDADLPELGAGSEDSFALRYIATPHARGVRSTSLVIEVLTRGRIHLGKRRVSGREKVAAIMDMMTLRGSNPADGTTLA
jgi:hypothetical protein